MPSAALKRAQKDQRRADGLAFITRKLGIPTARGVGRPTALMVEKEKLRGVLLDDFVGSRVVELSDWWPTEARKVYERLRWLPLHADMIIAEDEG